MATVPMAVAVDADWFSQQFAGSDQLQVKSYGTGIGTSPIVILPDTSFDAPMAPMPGTDGGTGDICKDIQLRTFEPVAAGVGTSPWLPPLRLASCHGTGCAAQQAVLDEMFSFATGIGTSPVWTPSSGVSLELWQHYEAVVLGYVNFGWVGDAAPIGDYGSVLDAAGIGLTPVSGSGGSGLGSQLMVE
jgi:hypothetical protein